MIQITRRIAAVTIAASCFAWPAQVPTMHSPTTQQDQVPRPILQSAQGEAINSQVAFSPDKVWLATAGRDPTIGIWQTESGRQYGVLSGHLGFILALVFGADGRQLVSVGRDQTVRLWDVAQLQELWNSGKITPEPSVAAISPDGRLLAVGTRDGTILLWPKGASKAQTLRSDHRDEIKAITFNKDGKSLVAAGRDGLITVTDISNLTSITFPAASAEVDSLAINSEGSQIVSGSHDGKITIWSVSERKMLESQSLKAEICSVSFDENKNRIVAASQAQEIGIWDRQARPTFRQYTLPVNPTADLMIFSIAVLPIVLSGDGQLVTASPGLGELLIFDVANGKPVRTFKNKVDGNRSVALNSTADNVAVGTSEGQVALWDLSVRGDQFAVLTGHMDPVTSVHFNPDGTLLVTADDKLAKTWHFPSLKPALQLRSPQGGFVYADEHWFAAGSDLQKPVTRIWPLDKSQPPRTVPIAHRLNVSGIVISPQSEWAASWSHLGQDMKIWDISNGTEVSHFEHSDFQAWVGTPAFSPNGKLLAWGTWIGDVRIVDRETQHELNLHEHTGPVYAVAFSEDGNLLASAGQDKTIKILEVSTGAERMTLTGHSSAVRSVVFSHDGRKLISTGADGTTRFWNLETQKELFSLSSLRDRGGWLAVAPNGLFDGSADAINSLGWRDPTTTQVIPLDALYNDFFYPGLLADLFHDQNPQPPYDLAARLRFPALRRMAEQGLASIQRRGDKVLLCLSKKAAPSSVSGMHVRSRGLDLTLGTEGFKENRDDLLCTYSKELPPQDAPYELVGTTTGWKPNLPNSRFSDKRDADVSKSTLHVLTVAVDKYSDAYSPLYFPVADANAVADFFRKQKQEKTLFADVNVRTGLRDETATRERIQSELAAMAKEVKEDDVVLLFFSGHGRVPPGQEMFYYIPFLRPTEDSGSLVDPLEERETGISTAMLAEAIRNLPARKVVLIVDACQSGGAVESLAKIGEVKLAIEQRRASQESASNRQAHQHDVGVYILAAATPVQDALEPFPEMAKEGKKNSLLTATLLEALDSKASDGSGTIWMKALFTRVKEDLPKLATKYHSIQTPFPVEVGEDFPIGAVNIRDHATAGRAPKQ